MGRQFAQPAEIIGSRDDPLAKNVVPEPVNDHPGRQGISIDDVFSKLAPSAAALRIHPSAEGIKKPPRNRFAWLIVVTAFEQWLHDGLGLDHAGRTRRGVNPAFQFTKLCNKRCHRRQAINGVWQQIHATKIIEESSL